MKSKKTQAIWLSGYALGVAALIVGMVSISNVAHKYDRALGSYFGYVGAEEKLTSDEVLNNERQAALDIVDEGGVLLKNKNNALPLAKSSKVTVFGQSAYMWFTKEKMTNNLDANDSGLLASLENAGLEVNTTQRSFYRKTSHKNWGIGANLGNGGIAGTWTIDELDPTTEPFSADCQNSWSDYNNAIVVFSRCGSEGGDLPRFMGRYGGSDSEHYLELNTAEKNLLKTIKNSGKFSKTIVVLHTGNAMQMDFADKEEYGIDSVLWISGTGEDGLQEVGKYFVEDGVNPSGKNVNTYVYDNWSSPAMQNFGDYRFTDAAGNLINAVTTNVGGTYSYMNYGEGIYVGYKYYETRYEDAVLKNSYYSGSYDYSKTVYAPFGFGLSYSTFDWANFKCSAPDAQGNITASVTVKNTSAVPGKEVVQFYFQSPYTDYDRGNGVEKASVNLIDFGKTKLLNQNESQTITGTFNLDDLCAYDSKTQKGYFLDAGTYYITAASDAHKATNNILNAKGKSVSDGMTENGDSTFVHSFTIDELTKRSTSSTGKDITNLFDDCKLEDANYLSRSAWSVLDSFNKETMLGGVAYATETRNLGTTGSIRSEVMDSNGRVGIHKASDVVITGLTTEGWDRSGNPLPKDSTEWPEYENGSTKTSYNLSEFAKASYDDPRWDDMVNQVKLEDQIKLITCAGWGTDAIDYVGMPDTYFLDGPQGMIDYVSDGKGYQYQNEVVLGATWSKELARLEGDTCSKEFAEKGASIWWAPAMNIHRTPFSGRNFEYFSEDGVHSGLLGKEWVEASQDNGVACQLKHFFLNDQETNRGANGRTAAFATEQAMREIYAEPFRICIEDGKAMGVMATMCRVGTTCTPCSYTLMTTLLRDEWGMKGAAISDAQEFTILETEQALAAGLDQCDVTAACPLSSETANSRGGQAMLHLVTKNNMYVAVNTIALGGSFARGFGIYNILLIVIDLIIVAYIAYAGWEIAMHLYMAPATVKFKSKRWIVRYVVWAISAALVIYLAIMFITTWGPLLKFAFQTF